MNKLTTTEAIDMQTVTGNVLMHVMSGASPEAMKRFEQVLGIAESKDEPKYEVVLTINGVEHDFHAFAEMLAATIDRHVMVAATKLVRETIGTKLVDATESVVNALDDLRLGIRAEAGRLLGFDPEGGTS